MTTDDRDLQMLEVLADVHFTAHASLGSSEIDSTALAGPQTAAGNAPTDPGTQRRLTKLMLEAQAESEARFARAARHPRAAEPAGGFP